MKTAIQHRAQIDQLRQRRQSQWLQAFRSKFQDI